MKHVSERKERSVSKPLLSVQSVAVMDVRLAHHLKPVTSAVAVVKFSKLLDHLSVR
jgi:hypothetical protein